MASIVVSLDKGVSKLRSVSNHIYNYLHNDVVGNKVDKVVHYNTEDFEARVLLNCSNFVWLFFLYLCKRILGLCLVGYEINDEIVHDGFYEVSRGNKVALARSYDDACALLDTDQENGQIHKKLLFASLNRYWNITSFMNTCATSFNHENKITAYELMLIVALKLGHSKYPSTAELVMIEDNSLKELVYNNRDVIDLGINCAPDVESINGVLVDNDDAIGGEFVQIDPATNGNEATSLPTLIENDDIDDDEEDVDEEDVDEEDVDKEDVDKEDVDKEDVDKEDVDKEDVDEEDVNQEDNIQ
jgi:hypothetical protein